MAEYTGFQALLNGALGEYKDAGFRLTEPDDHTLYLLYHDKLVVPFSSTGATFDGIRRACQTFLDRIRVREYGSE
jgi:hypothetical protein